MNLPNKITILRICFIPILMLFVLPVPESIINAAVFSSLGPQLNSINNFIALYGGYVGAGLFIIASATDAVDGYMARKHKMVTNFGKFLDPIADKLLVVAALMVLVQKGDVNAWAAMIIISREFIVTAFRLVAAGEGVVIAASKLAKLKTIIQDVAISAAFLRNFPISLFSDFRFDYYSMILAVIVTVYSLYDYLNKNKDILNYSA